MPTLAVGPGVESILVELYGVDPDAARWDADVWDGAESWGATGWQGIGCQVAELSSRWGSTDEAGVLSIASNGGIDVRTIDPHRVLDPTNGSSPFLGAIRPGTPIRYRSTDPGGQVAATGFLDQATYDMAAGRGTLRAVDAVAYMAQAQVPDGTVLPNTLRARVRAAVAAAGLATLVPVEADTPDMDPDPPVAPHDGKARAAWAIITDAGTDALYYVYVGPQGYVRFRSFGALPDAPIGIGCPPAGDPGPWAEGLSTIVSTVQAGAIRNTVRAYSAGTTFTPPVTDPPSVQRYGPRALDVQRVVPDFANWAAHVLQDRADAGLAVDLGVVRPYDRADLDGLLSLAAVGPCILSVVDQDHPPPTDMDVAVIGAQVGVTPAGWRFQLVTMIPRASWAPMPAPPEPPIPPPVPFHTETRTYIGTSDALLALTSGGAKYGAGAANSLPVGAYQGWTYRSCIQLPSIPWTKVRRVVSATLKLRTSSQVRVAFGSGPTIEVRRITESWSAGSSSSPSSGNAVVYPGPSTTSAGAVRANVSKNEQTDVSIRIDAIAKAWGPAAVGGSSAAQRGVMLLPGSGSTADTTEFWPVEQGGAARPQLVLVVEVND